MVEASAPSTGSSVLMPRSIAFAMGWRRSTEGGELVCSGAWVPICHCPCVQNGDGGCADVGGTMVGEFASGLFSARKGRSGASSY
jgi:hypothetical protein